MSARLGRVTTLLIAVLAVLAALLATPTAQARTAAEVDVQAGSEDAVAALETVRDVVEDVAGPGGRGAPVAVETEAIEPTMALRDLALLRHDLTAAQQRQADGYLARPTDNGSGGPGDELRYETEEATPECSDVVCVHYVTSTRDAVNTTDTSGNGVPDYVDRALRTATDVHTQYVAAGYRAPKPDGALGGNALPDIYLADVGSSNLYGYCTTDQLLPSSGPYDAWAYCVLDNNYSKTQFPSNTPRENLQVTTAHEYFHAVQFAYDIAEDPWFMEATATWAEDEVFDDVNDNVQYLDSSPLTEPQRSMDQFSGLFHYGTWIFFRHLTERFPDEAGGMPTLVRDMWRRADDAPNGIGEYSLQAVSEVLERRGLTLSEAFARFSQANRMPDRSYDESRANRYPSSPLAERIRLRRAEPRSGQSRLRLDHLTSGTVRYQPAPDLGGRAWQLRLKLDLPSRFKDPVAVVRIMPKSGAPTVELVKLTKKGNAKQSYGFSSRNVRYVEVTLVNASNRFTCNRNTLFSCSGRAKDDRSAYLVSARAFKRR